MTSHQSWRACSFGYMVESTEGMLRLLLEGKIMYSVLNCYVGGHVIGPIVDGPLAEYWVVISGVERTTLTLYAPALVSR